MESAQDSIKSTIPKTFGDPEPCPSHGPRVATEFEVFGEKRIRYSCAECDAERANEEAQEKAQRDTMRIQDGINRRVENSMISPRFKDKTLANWTATTDAQKKALSVATAFTASHSRSPGMIFVGRPGTGKNHLACGIVQEVIRRSGETALVCSAMKILRSIKESWKKDGETESKILQSYRDVDLLVIDELGVQFGSETEWIFITEIINDRYEWLKPTILISNLNMPKLTELLGDRVIDRFKEGGHIVVFDWESQRGKV